MHGASQFADRHAQHERGHVHHERHAIGECRFEHDGIGPALLRDVGQARHLLAVANRHCDGTQPLDREQRDDEFAAVAHVDQHTLTGTDAVRSQSGGGTLHGRLQRGVGPAPIPADQCLGVRLPCGAARKQVEQAGRTIGKAAHHAVAIERLVAQRR
ncbi:hypothetical protein D9M72_547640 [compost metagenome]